METTRKQFNAQTVDVDARADGRGNRLPCLNVKVRHGFDSITPEQWDELRNMARDHGTIPEDSLSRLNGQWCYDHDSNGDCFNDACRMQFESAEEDAKALFGKHIECFQDGRSGGWLIVKGLDDVECWSEVENALPSLKGSNVEGARFTDGTRLADDANIFERWAFFEEVCAGLVKDVPYECASLLALNVFPQLEGTRDVEFLRAWKAYDVGTRPTGRSRNKSWTAGVQKWDTETLAVPGKVTGHDDLVAYYLANTGKPSPADSIAYVGVFNDPKGD